MKRAGRVGHAALALALAGLGCCAAVRAAGSFDTNIDSAAIEQAIAVGRSSDAARQRFHAQYRIALDDSLLNQLEIVTEYRRVVLATEDRVRAGDIGWGLPQATAMLAPWRDRVSLILHVTFSPDNVYRAMPRFAIVLYARPHTAGTDQIQPLDLFETPRYVSDQPAPPGTPILSGLIQADFSVRNLDRRGIYLGGIALEGRELRRVEIDFGRMQ